MCWKTKFYYLLGFLSFFLFLCLCITIFWVPKFFYIFYIFSICYLVFCFAYLPKGWIRKFNLIGDYSYGLYIYAFPIQQAVILIFVDIGVLEGALISFSMSLVLAILSWHFVERPFLKKNLISCRFAKSKQLNKNLSWCNPITFLNVEIYLLTYFISKFFL